MDLQDLQASVMFALDMADADTTISAAEVCASWVETQTVQVQYEDAHPYDAVQPLQASTQRGMGIVVVIESADGRRVGFGSHDDDVSPEGIRQALERAKASAAPIGAGCCVGMPTPGGIAALPTVPPRRRVCRR